MATPDTQMYASLDELRTEHGRLLRASKEPAGRTDGATDTVAEKVVAFLSRARATGARLDFPADREAAQRVLDYWTATLFMLPNGVAAAQALPSSIPGVTAEAVNLQLERFDPGTIDNAVRDADAWLARPGGDQTLARRVLLRLVRLHADKPVFDPVPTVRGALYDLDAAEPVNAVIARLAAAGVVRVTKGDSEEMDRVALRSSDLLWRWKTLENWCEERRRFRGRVEEWTSVGRPDKTLLIGTELDEAREYHDRNKLEREFVNASADEQARSLKQAAVDRRAKWRWRVLALGALVGWFGTGVYFVKAYHATRDAERATREAQRLAEDEANRAKFELSRAEKQRLYLERLRQDTARFNDLRRLVRLQAELVVTASDVEQHELALDNWHKLIAEIGQEEPFRSILNLENARETAVDSANTNALSSRVLQQIRALFTELVHGAELESSVELARDPSFAVVELSVRGIVDILTNGNPIGDAEPFIREFWRQYWGEMLLFENQEVESEMVGFGKVLVDIKTEVESPHDELKASIEDFSKEYLKDPDEFAKKELRLNAASFAQLKLEYSDIPVDAYNALLRKVDSRKVSPALIRQLREQQAPLLKAIEKERRAELSYPAKAKSP